jgi:SlyX protein
MSNEQALATRIEALENQMAFQDQTIEDLNKTITDQWAEFDKLRREISRLKSEINDVHSSIDGPGNGEPPPPHY